MMRPRTIAMVLLALVAVGCHAQPPASGTPEAVLAELKAGTRYAHVNPAITVKPNATGMSVALCGHGIIMGIDQSDPEFRWTLAHEWGHMVACGDGYQPPAGWPASPEVQPWAGSPVGWNAENWADCVALVLTGVDGGPSRDYPPCNEDQRAFTSRILFATP